MDNGFWYGKKILVTGHTGFKGSWLTLWLTSLGAEVTGYSQAPPSVPNLFEDASLSELCTSVQGDLLDYPKLLHVFEQAQPEIVFHLAAQPLVQRSYQEPVDTFQTNVMGTVYMLEAVRHSPSVRVMINVTSDKCYLNGDDKLYAFTENDPLGGRDPYSASKACAEIVTAAYRDSFYRNPSMYPRIASVRAGNVIGGGDWAEGRLFPDLVRAFMHSKPIHLRNPHAIRPWQHVLDPLHGYMLLAQKLWDDARYAEAWNFGPVSHSRMSVDQMIRLAAQLWNEPLHIEYPANSTAAHGTSAMPTLHPEASFLALDSSKAVHSLGWSPKLAPDVAVAWTVNWYRRYLSGQDMRSYTLQQIDHFNKG